MNQQQTSILKDFIRFCKKELEIQSLPKISLITDPTFVEQARSFGEYNVTEMSIRVYSRNRNLADVCRSLAHELVHHRQSELGLLYDLAGNTGSDIENDANSIAGIIMREYGKLNVGVYDLKPIKSSINEVGEGVGPYKWSYDFVDDDGNYHYSFKTPQNDYSVGVSYEGDDAYAINFWAGSEFGLDTNENVAYKVMSTVVDIMHDFINKNDPSELMISPIQTKGTTPEERSKDQRRSKFYGAILRKNLPHGYGLMSVGDGYRLIKRSVAVK